MPRHVKHVTAMSISTLQDSDYIEWSALFRQLLDLNNAKLPESQYQNTFSRMVAEDGDLYALVLRDINSGKMLGFSHYMIMPSHMSEQHNCHLSGMYCFLLHH